MQAQAQAYAQQLHAQAQLTQAMQMQQQQQQQQQQFADAIWPRRAARMLEESRSARMRVEAGKAPLAGAPLPPAAVLRQQVFAFDSPAPSSTMLGNPGGGGGGGVSAGNSVVGMAMGLGLGLGVGMAGDPSSSIAAGQVHGSGGGGGGLGTGPMAHGNALLNAASNIINHRRGSASGALSGSTGAAGLGSQSTSANGLSSLVNPTGPPGSGGVRYQPSTAAAPAGAKPTVGTYNYAPGGSANPNPQLTAHDVAVARARYVGGAPGVVAGIAAAAAAAAAAGVAQPSSSGSRRVQQQQAAEVQRQQQLQQVMVSQQYLDQTATGATSSQQPQPFPGWF